MQLEKLNRPPIITMNIIHLTRIGGRIFFTDEQRGFMYYRHIYNLFLLFKTPNLQSWQKFPGDLAVN